MSQRQQQDDNEADHSAATSPTLSDEGLCKLDGTENFPVPVLSVSHLVSE